VNGGILGPGPASWAAAGVASWAAAGASAGWTSRASARIYLNANQGATGAAGTFVAALNAAAFDASGFASLGQNALVVPAGLGGVYLVNWGIFYTGGLGSFSQITQNGSVVGNGSGSTRSVGAAILQLAAADIIKLQAVVTASEVFGGSAAPGPDTWLSLVRYQ
jgi:hypothetical protein